MNFLKAIFGHKHSRIWFIVTAVLLVLFLVLTILASTVFYQILCNVLGDPRRIVGEGGAKIYTADFNSKEEARLNGEAVNEQICDEGFVLLANKDNALPLNKGSKVSVFGKNSVNIVTGGSGSGASSGEYEKSLYESLAAAGFDWNGSLKAFYDNKDYSGEGRSPNPSMEADSHTPLYTGETPLTSYSNGSIDSYIGNYSDAALIVISRIGGEGWDLPRAMRDKNGNKIQGARNIDDHYLQLDQNETDLINAVCNSETFGKVVILINSASPMELGFLDDDTHYAYNSKIDACLWIGTPGDTGIMSLGRILNGDVSPSGKTPDIYARNFKNDPTWPNFATNENGGSYTDISGQQDNLLYTYVDYEEGIYVGYRYYETRGAAAGITGGEGDTWYKKNVLYPFGHGLSYTYFSQRIIDKSGLNGSALTKSDKITVKVEVTNEGTRAGRDSVQIYLTAPYTPNGLEKSHVVLAGFGKTGLLSAKGGGSDTETVEIKIDPYDLASYDYSGKSGFKGFILEKGAYMFKLAKNSHDVIDSFTLNLAADIKYDTDPVSKNAVENRFDDASRELGSVFSRTSFTSTYPAARSEEEKKIKSDTNTSVNSFETNNNFSTTVIPEQGKSGSIKFADLIGKPYDHPDWDRLLDRLTINEMTDLFNTGAFKTNAIMSIEKPMTTDSDGPGGFVSFMAKSPAAPVYGTSHYCGEPVMAATFNTDLLFAFGEAVGNEALIGNERGDGAPYSGWYAPGVNIHRSPFGGRTGEYFSEDPYLSGMLAAAEIRGAMSKGVYTQVKHFAVNDQETFRAGVCTWLTEQALREIYLRPFEKAVKEGGTTGIMSAFNRIGAVWTGGDYRLLTKILRDEWNFRGMVISDFNTNYHMNARQMAYAGGDLNLRSLGQTWSPRKSSAADLTVLRNCAHNILYTVVNSNAMNDEILGYNWPVWQVLLAVFDGVLLLGLAAWGFFAIRSGLKKNR